MQTPIERWRAVPVNIKMACLQGADKMVAELEQAHERLTDPAQAADVQAVIGTAEDVAAYADAVAGQLEAWRAATALLAAMGG